MEAHLTLLLTYTRSLRGKRNGWDAAAIVTAFGNQKQVRTVDKSTRSRPFAAYPGSRIHVGKRGNHLPVGDAWICGPAFPVFKLDFRQQIAHPRFVAEHVVQGRQELFFCLSSSRSVGLEPVFYSPHTCRSSSCSGTPFGQPIIDCCCCFCTQRYLYQSHVCPPRRIHCSP